MIRREAGRLSTAIPGCTNARFRVLMGRGNMGKERPEAAMTTDQERELAELRGRAAEHELAYRQAQERINDFERDWLYATTRGWRLTYFST